VTLANGRGCVGPALRLSPAGAPAIISLVTRARNFLIASAVVAICLIVFFNRPLAFLALLGLGRSPACGYAEAWRGFAGKRAQQEALYRDFAASVRLVQKDARGYELYRTPQSPVWVPPGNHDMLLWLLTEMGRKVYETEGYGVRKGDVVLDCGAHVGLFTREALSAGATLVVAIEPAPENLECLRRNLSDEIRAGRVVVVPKGVWDREDTLTLQISPAFSAGDTILPGAQASAGTYRVPVTRIDTLVAELALARVDFIKMNIEGAEQQALAGARGTLARFRPRMAVSGIHHDDDYQAIPTLARQGWSGYRMRCGACFVDRDHLRILPEVMFFF
jgi:FkbM family methyltransferase